MTEKRSHSRRALSKPLEVEISTSTSKNSIDAATINISKGGACIVTDRSLEPGRIVMFKRPLEEVDFELLGFAEVKWVTSDDDRFKVGVEFLA
jgi:hypothetical protein